MKLKILKVKAWLKFAGPDYDGFIEHIKAWEREKISFGIKELEELSKNYGTPIPSVERGDITFDVNVKDFIKK